MTFLLLSHWPKLNPTSQVERIGNYSIFLAATFLAKNTDTWLIESKNLCQT